MKMPSAWGCTGSLLLAGALLALGAAVSDARPPARPGVQPRRAETPVEAPDAAPTEEEPALPVVGSLRWEGNENLSNAELSAVAFTRGPDWRIWRADPEFSEPTLAGDMSRVEALYRQHGFYEAEADYTLEWSPDRSRVAITVHVEEGPDVTLTRFELDVPDDIDVPAEQQAGLRDDLALVVGQRFSAERYARAKETLLDRLAQAAHPRARIEGGASVDLEAHEAEVTWRIVPGPTVFFGEVTIRGLYTVDEATARREVRIEPGQRYSTRALQRTRRGLQTQGLYSWVAIQARPAPAGSEAAADALDVRPKAPETGDGEAGTAPEKWDYEVWPVEIRVTEHPPFTVDAGIGYSSDEKFRATAGWRNGNFLGDARKLRFAGQYSSILSKLEAELVQPYFIDPRISLITRASYRYETEPGFVADRLLGSVGISRPVTETWRGRATYEISWQDVTRIAPASLFYLAEPEGTSRVATIELGMRRVTTDDILVPTEGTWLDLVVAPSLREIGSQFDFIGFLAEGRVYLPTYFDGVLAGRLVIGTKQPIRGTTADEIPVVSRFYSGGSNTHRGFTYHRMPPAGTANDTVGGTSLIEGSLEWRVPVWGKFGAVVFVDSGVLDLDPWRFPLGDLYWAVGPGLRYDTVVGPLRFDYGFLINPPPGFSRHRWFISVGHAF
jgi:outer membrane translocation and assembly module TamA